jgi:Tol biopolymer transport system component/DNA-binding winged helix-turn-helix (wHTH) protein
MLSRTFPRDFRGNSRGGPKMFPIYEFDDVRVDPGAFRVTKAGRPVALEPKAFEVLLFFLGNPGRLVEKKELLEKVWPETVVTESAMTRVIADLRRALGDDAREARYIETVPTKGYRFIAEVKRGDDATSREMPAPSPGEAHRPSRAGWVTAAVTLLGLGVFAAVFFAVRAPRSRPTAAPSPPSAKLTQVTESLGLDLFPSFSPDGAQIAYCSDRGNSFEIFVRQLASGGREIQITSDANDNTEPAWSPDGREIAYASRGRPGIWLVPALGGTPRRLTAFGSRPAWSPDGATIAFQSDGLMDLAATAPAAAPPSSLFLVPAGGGSPVPLTRPGSPEGGHGAPAFSRDGKTVLFATWALHRGSEIWSVSRQDGSRQRVMPRERNQVGQSFYYDPVSSSRGDWIYFAATSGTWLNASIWRIRVPPAAGGSWGEPEQVTSPGSASLRQIAISPHDGATLAYAALSTASNIWSLPIDARSATVAGPAALLTRAAGCRNTTPVYSPDGTHIAFVSCRAGGNTNVWLMDPDGQNARQLTENPAGVSDPGWFPDGERIAYMSTRGGTKALWSVTLPDRSERSVIPVDAEMSSSRLSPDGRSLTFTSRTAAGLLSVWVAPLDGGAARQVTFDREGGGYACWSPDGKTLAFELLRGPDMHVAIVPAAGGEPTILTHERGLSWPHGWSPDGERILFAGRRDGLWNVYWVPRSGRSEQRLTNYTNRHSFVRYPSWSPRGDQIVFEYSETTGNVWLLEAPR